MNLPRAATHTVNRAGAACKLGGMLEDETGCVNVIVWRDLGVRQRRELLSARLMVVYGSVEREGAVVHLIARRLADHSELLGRLGTRSRDFH